MPSSTLDYKDETYLVAFEAKTAIWIVSEPSPEHVSTIAWLNESSLASFYLAKVEAIQIEGVPFPHPSENPTGSRRHLNAEVRRELERWR